MSAKMVSVRTLLTWAAALTLSGGVAATADTIMVKPTGEFAKIDVARTNQAIDMLKGSAEQRKKAILEIEATPQNYAPPVFYLLSNVLFSEGRKDDAAFWFYAGQLRGRYDANRCADISAREAVAVLNMQFGKPINTYTMQNLPKLEKIVQKVVLWDEKTPHNYDHRWINLHGMGAMMSGLDPDEQKKEALSLPREQWDNIAQQTRKTYLEQFQQAMVELKKAKASK